MSKQQIKLKRLEEIVGADKDGNVILYNNDSPTAEQVFVELKIWARQGMVAKEINDTISYKLNKPHPKIGEATGTLKTKTEWMKDHNLEDRMFEAISTTGYLQKLR